METERRPVFFSAVFAMIGPGLAILIVGWLSVSQSERTALAEPPTATPADPQKSPDKPASDRVIRESWPAERKTPRAVAAGLYWLAKHQSPDGKWSLEKYTEQCKDKTCTGAGSIESLPAATALGLLPFLAAGQSQASKGPFQTIIDNGVKWIIGHQKADGDLSADAASQMYSHGLATMALCEDYATTHDKDIGDAAQKAINFIEFAQNKQTGGWRYHPGEEGDMSVFGWQMSALKSAQLAGLAVKPATWDGAKKWLNSCADATNAGRFSYQPEGGPTPPMSAIGVLANQYMKAGRADPVVTGGVQLLMANKPDPKIRNVYYWFYGTEVMHNMADKDWDAWWRRTRDALVESQDHEGCASGSWDPAKPTKDAWGPYGGRLMQTSLSCLTLEVYYRYLKLYQLDKDQPPSDDHSKK